MSKADVLASNIIPDVIDDVVEGSGTRISVAFGDSPLEFGQLIPPGEVSGRDRGWVAAFLGGLPCLVPALLAIRIPPPLASAWIRRQSPHQR